MGNGDPAEVAMKRLRDASNYAHKKGFGASYTFEHNLFRDIALRSIFCGRTSRRSSSVSRQPSHTRPSFAPRKTYTYKVLEGNYSMVNMLTQVEKTRSATRGIFLISRKRY